MISSFLDIFPSLPLLDWLGFDPLKVSFCPGTLGAAEFKFDSNSISSLPTFVKDYGSLVAQASAKVSNVCAALSMSNPLKPKIIMSLFATAGISVQLKAKLPEWSGVGSSSLNFCVPNILVFDSLDCTGDHGWKVVLALILVGILYSSFLGGRK